MLPNVNPTFSRQAEQQGQNFPQIEWPASAVSHPSCSLGSDLDKAREEIDTDMMVSDEECHGNVRGTKNSNEQQKLYQTPD